MNYFHPFFLNSRPERRWREEPVKCPLCPSVYSHPHDVTPYGEGLLYPHNPQDGEGGAEAEEEKQKEEGGHIDALQ